MKSNTRARKFLKDEQGVFGLTSVQTFFAILLGLALLAYVIIVIMSTLDNSTILPNSSLSRRINNETGGFTNTTGYTLAQSTTLGFASPSIVVIINGSGGEVINSGNYTLSSAGVLTNASTITYPALNISYTFNYNAFGTNQADYILRNTSGGVAGFFSSINPIYAILAILVIILVLVVLVRVVAGKEGGYSSSPQL